VATELTDHITDASSKQSAEEMYVPLRTLRADDIVRIILTMITQPPQVAINEVLVRPTYRVR
jgi:NADP-dependent 3-hydroxy acid dehydrogenase YdfG